MPERNWRRSKERIWFRRKCSGQFNIERTQWRSASAGRFSAFPTPQILRFIGQCKGNEFGDDKKLKIEENISQVIQVADDVSNMILGIFDCYENADYKKAQTDGWAHESVGRRYFYWFN